MLFWIAVTLVVLLASISAAVVVCCVALAYEED